MRKLTSFRDWLLGGPLPIDAAKLLTFAEKGVITSHRGMDHQNNDFAVTFDAHVIVTDYTGEPLQLFFLAVQWLHKECPGAKPDAIRFHADVIDTKRVDISLKVELTETVTAASSDAGTWLSPDTDPDALHAALFPGQA